METRNAKSEKRKQVAAGGGGKTGRGEKGRLKVVKTGRGEKGRLKAEG